MPRSPLLILLLHLLVMAQADVLLHSPRGQNNRCDEKANRRNSDTRCFNSQNMAAGGYAICDKEMEFYTGTVVPIEWHSEHGCGNGEAKDDPLNPRGVRCNTVVQLGCDFSFATVAGSAKDTYQLTDGISLGRPGADEFNDPADDADKFNTFGNTCTQTQPLTSDCETAGDTATGNSNEQDDPNNPCNANLSGGNTGTFNSNTCKCHKRKKQTYCNHEPEAWWLKCRARERNKGLFTADQYPGNGNGATNTRQEPNSARFGFECPEERDYWPYWHPTPWIDLAVITSEPERCDFYRSNSQNVVPKCECVGGDAAMAHNNEDACTGGGFSWNCTQVWQWPAPECSLAPFQQENSMGPVKDDKASGLPLPSFHWLIPERVIPEGRNEVRCLIRIRYNISSAEVPDSFRAVDNPKLSQYQYQISTFGENDADEPPEVAIPLRLAISTNQHGRVFQDRSYTFRIKKRPAELLNKTIHNVNVRGKRGNLAQIVGCLEYEFVPLVLKANNGDYVHFQWCLSDYNDNNNFGEGRVGTDRVNIVPLSSYSQNIFPRLDSVETIFLASDLKKLAWLGQLPQHCYTTSEMLTTKRNSANDPRSCHYLNGVRDESGMPTAYFSHLAKITSTGTFHFMSSRNNHFSNRSQKGTIVVRGPQTQPPTPTSTSPGTQEPNESGNASGGQIAGAFIGGLFAGILLLGVGFLVFRYFHQQRTSEVQMNPKA